MGENQRSPMEGIESSVQPGRRGFSRGVIGAAYNPLRSRAWDGPGWNYALCGSAPIVQRPRTLAFQASNTGSNPVGGALGAW